MRPRACKKITRKLAYLKEAYDVMVITLTSSSLTDRIARVCRHLDKKSSEISSGSWGTYYVNLLREP